jgi:hypothetical protein
MLSLSNRLKKICDLVDVVALERIKQRITMDEIDAMMEYMESKRFPLEDCEWYDEDEFLLVTCAKFVSEYHIVRFMRYLKKIR